MILLNGKYRFRWLFSFAGIFILLAVYMGPVTDALGGVEFDSIHEMMSVPVMQLGRSATLKADELTEEELKEIEKYVPYYRIYVENQQGIADWLKNYFDSNDFKDNPLRFLKLWYKIGRKCPTEYYDAFARLTIGLWYPDMNYRDIQAYHPYWEYDCTPQTDQDWIYVERKTPKCLKWLSDFYWNLSYNNTYQSFPIISMLFSSGLIIWLVLLCTGYIVFIRK